MPSLSSSAGRYGAFLSVALVYSLVRDDAGNMALIDREIKARTQRGSIVKLSSL